MIFNRRRGGRHAPSSDRLGTWPGGGVRVRPDQGADRLARHGFVPCRRARHRHHRSTDQGGRVHARRRAGQGRPERQVSGRADVRAVLPAAESQGQAAAAAVARRRAHRRDLRDQARRRRRLAQLFHPQGLGHLHLRRRGARPFRLDQHLQGRGRVPAPSAIHASASASVRPVRGTTTRASARPIRARSFRSRPTINS